MKPTGSYVTASTAGETFRAFVPDPLPPDPPLELTESDHDLIERANRSLGRLDGVATVLPDVSLLLYFYVRKEAVLSSQIEGTQSSFSDLLLHEEDLAPGVPVSDVQEVSNSVRAMNHGLQRLRRDDFPLSVRLIREVHRVLLTGGRGGHSAPGELRRSQNWLGGTRPGNARFVPPPPDRVAACMADLERFLNDRPRRTPVLIKAALAHVQFETVHPFLDGNGRVGRLLITLILCHEAALEQPLLYLSLFFKQHRTEYYDRLDAVRAKGDWLGWLRFFLEGVELTAQQAAETAARILALFDDHRRRIESLGRSAASAHRLHELLCRRPVTTVPKATGELHLSAPTARTALENLQSLGIVREITGKRRDRVYAYHPYVQILDEGTEPIA